VLISGVIYAARDVAHHRLTQALDKGDKLPFDLNGQTLYYMGPSPARPGQVVGSAGPTTSIRMDMYTPRLIAQGVRATIGKGNRSPAVKEAIKKYKAVYLATIGGAGALIAKSIRKIEVIAYEDLGPAAILRLEVDRDINPQAPTHLVIIPKRHIPSLAQLTEAESSLVGHMVSTANQLAKREGIAESGYRLVINCGKEGGQLVPHLHLHLLGGRKLSDKLG